MKKYPAILYILTDERRKRLQRIVEELDHTITDPTKGKVNILDIVWYGVGESPILMSEVKEWLGVTENKNKQHG